MLSDARDPRRAHHQTLDGAGVSRHGARGGEGQPRQPQTFPWDREREQAGSQLHTGPISRISEGRLYVLDEARATSAPLARKNGIGTRLQRRRRLVRLAVLVDV